MKLNRCGYRVLFTRDESYEAYNECIVAIMSLELHV